MLEMRSWRNWQTRKTKDLVSNIVRVQVPASAPNKNNPNLLGADFFIAFYFLFFHFFFFSQVLIVFEIKNKREERKVQVDVNM